MDKFWRTDGPVLAILVTNDTAYIGGQFSYVGPDTGNGGVVDAVSAEFKPGFPAVTARFTPPHLTARAAGTSAARFPPSAASRAAIWPMCCRTTG